MSPQTQAAIEQMVFRKTNAHAGRHLSVTPSNSTNRHLAYGRIILSESNPSASFDTGDRETGLHQFNPHVQTRCRRPLPARGAA